MQTENRNRNRKWLGLDEKVQELRNCYAQGRLREADKKEAGQCVLVIGPDYTVP